MYRRLSERRIIKAEERKELSPVKLSNKKWIDNKLKKIELIQKWKELKNSKKVLKIQPIKYLCETLDEWESMTKMKERVPEMEISKVHLKDVEAKSWIVDLDKYYKKQYFV